MDGDRLGGTAGILTVLDAWWAVAGTARGVAGTSSTAFSTVSLAVSSVTMGVGGSGVITGGGRGTAGAAIA